MVMVVVVGAIGAGLVVIGGGAVVKTIRLAAFEKELGGNVEK